MAGEKLTVTLEGWGNLAKALSNLGPRIGRKVGNKSLRAGAELIAEQARTYVPVDTGELQDSIAVVTGRSAAASEFLVQVGFRKNASWRAHFVEYGTVKMAAEPFMRPAIDSRGEDAISLIGGELWQGIEAEANKAPKGGK